MPFGMKTHLHGTDSGKGMTRIQRKDEMQRQKAMELTSYMLHKYYCENDVEAVIALMDDDIVWLGTGEEEHSAGLERVAAIFRRFAGQVPRCNLSGEEYQGLQIATDAYMCSGRVWIATDASTQISLRVHQRITTVFRNHSGRLRCCHLHISNPYEDMVEGDVGFPERIARQSYQYLQEQVEAQKEKIAAQTALLQRMSYEDTLTGLFNRNKFNELMADPLAWPGEHRGVACFDLNGLKEINDWQGHSAGDGLLRRAAEHIRKAFGEKVYRTGGDEFVVVDETLDEEAFRLAVAAVRTGMEQDEIRCSVGFSWRSVPCSLREQFDEADFLMYQEKRRFYGAREHDRRKQS